MNIYKYFSDVLKNGYFTETPCQFCGGSEHCLEGSFLTEMTILYLYVSIALINEK